MNWTNVEKHLPVVGMLVAACMAQGCNLFDQHSRMLDRVGGAATEVAQRVGEEGIGQFAAGGQAINPGIRVSAGVEYFAQARFEGLAGQISASGQGKLDRDLTDDERLAIMRIFNDSSLSEEARRNAIFGWITRILSERASAATQPVPP